MGAAASLLIRKRHSEISAGHCPHTTPIWQKQLQQGEHLKKCCKLWALTWQKEVGWAPEAGRDDAVNEIFPLAVDEQQKVL